MKPIILKIKGLNSFVEEQIINFEKLTKKGIFGIFGPTGSGKTTIIDAMTLALYGVVSRYDGTKESKAFFNTSSTNLNVLFGFSIKLKNTIYYEVEREYKRKKDGSIGSPAARLIKKDELGNITVISDKVKEINKEIVRIIGLKYEDFTRSVILPQGKFSQFLMLENKDRRDMLERIFSLEKYGSKLSEKLNIKKNNQKCIIENISIQLNALGDVSPKRISELEEKLKSENEALENTEKKLSEKNKLLNEYSKYLSLCDEKNIYINEKNLLDNKKSYIKEKSDFLDKVLKAKNVYPYFKRYSENNEKNIKNNSLLKDYKNKLLLCENELKNKTDLYNNALKRKEEEYAFYLKKETDLSQAEKLLEYVNKLSNEREKLLNEYKDKKIEYDKNLEELDYNMLMKEKSCKKLDEIIKHKKELTIIPEYYEDIIKASKLEEKYNEFLNSKKENNNLLNDKMQLYENQKNELLYIKEEYNKKNEKYVKNKKELDNILLEEATLPDIFSLQKEFYEEKDFFESQKIKSQKLFQLKEAINNKNSENQKYIDNIKFLENKILECNNNINELKEKQKKIEFDILLSEAAEKLNNETPCPLCGSFHHPNLAHFKYDENSNNIKEELQKEEKKLKKYDEEKQKCNLSIEYIKENISEINNEIEKLDFNDKNYDIDKNKKILDDKDKNINILKEKSEYIADKKKGIENKNTEYIAEIKDYELKIAEIKKGIQKDEELINQYKKIIENINININDINSKFQPYKEKYKIKSFIEEYKKIRGQEIERASIEKKETEERAIIEKYNTKIEKINILVNKLDLEIQNTLTIGEEKRKVIEENNEIIIKLSDGRNVKKYINEVKKCIEEIIKNEKLYKEEHENALNERNKVFDTVTNLESKKNILEEILSKQFDEYMELIKTNGFSKDDNISDYIIKDEVYQNISNEINLFENSFMEICVKLNNINEKISKIDISCSKEQFEALKDEIENYENNQKMYINNIGAISYDIENTKQNSKKAKVFLNDLKNQEHKLDIINEIISVIQGNKFVEYAAKNQLKYITKEASFRISQMTRGRYCITLDNSEDLVNLGANKISGANFVIKDNYSGGIARIPKTLSGGEVFLMSLCLALALSSKIQLRNSAPLEIFFLDEGFGTLDSELLDTVMDSLEKLSVQNINVGIISHIDELKYRMPVRLNVVPPKNGVSGSHIFID